jgi:hypothetical protein
VQISLRNILKRRCMYSESFSCTIGVRVTKVSGSFAHFKTVVRSFVSCTNAYNQPNTNLLQNMFACGLLPKETKLYIYKISMFQPLISLKYKKGVYCTGMKLFSNPSLTIKCLNHNMELFKPALREYLLSYSYFVKEVTFIKNLQL